MDSEIAIRLGHAAPALEARRRNSDTGLLKDAKDAIQIALLRIGPLAEAATTRDGDEGLNECLARLDDAGAVLSLAMRKIEDAENFR